MHKFFPREILLKNTCVQTFSEQLLNRTGEKRGWPSGEGAGLESGGRGFKTALTTSWSCFTVDPSSTVNSQLVCLLLVGIFKLVMFKLKLFVSDISLLGSNSLCAINTAEGKKMLFIYLIFYFSHSLCFS